MRSDGSSNCTEWMREDDGSLAVPLATGQIGSQISLKPVNNKGQTALVPLPGRARHARDRRLLELPVQIL